MIFATLLYITNSKGEYLLLKRKKVPNKNLLSPPGGKVNISDGESPFQCAVREAEEECGILSNEKDWKLLGIITEKNYPDAGNILLYCFKYKKNIINLPPDFSEGDYYFVKSEDIMNSPIPQTDKLYIWKFVLNYKRFFSIYIDCNFTPYKCKIEN